MKTVAALLALLLLGYSSSNAQFKQGQVELSFSGSIGSFSPPSTPDYKLDAQNYVSLYVVPGYYILDGLSVEPELGLMAEESSKPAQYLLLNLSYTYLIPETKIGCFVRGGYGISNSMEYPFGNGVVIPASDKFNVGVLNLGVGAKFLISSSVLIRTEFNYKKHSWKDEYNSPYYSYSLDFTESTIGVILGFSILL